MDNSLNIHCRTLKPPADRQTDRWKALHKSALCISTGELNKGSIFCRELQFFLFCNDESKFLITVNLSVSDKVKRVDKPRSNRTCKQVAVNKHDK